MKCKCRDLELIDKTTLKCKTYGYLRTVHSKHKNVVKFVIKNKIDLKSLTPLDPIYNPK